MDYKKYFDIPNDITYLNTPGNGLMPISHHRWRRERELDFFDVSGDLRDKQPQFIAEVKQTLGSLFNCPKEQLYLVPNFSFGLHTVLSGFSSSAKLLILEGDYPSLNYPAYSRGFELMHVAMTADIEEKLYDKIVKEKPSALLLSLVQYISGLKIDLNYIKKLKADFPEMLIIGDGTQFLGTEPFDFLSSGFDLLGGSGYKWLLAGFGNGYLMMSQYLQSKLFQKAQEGKRPVEAMWENKTILDTFFEPGHQDTLAHGTLLQSILFLQELGLENIQHHLQEISEYAYAKFEDKGWLLSEIKNRSVRSSLINVQVDPKLYPWLMSNGIKCFPRGTGIRIGLHLYNTKEDIDKFVEIIERKR